MMVRLAAVALALAMLAGCQEGERFRSRAMGEVDPAAALAAAQDVLSDYYAIAEVDHNARRITSQPKHLSDQSAGLLSRTAARERAVLRLRQEGRGLWADVSVVVERQESPRIAAVSSTLMGPRTEAAPGPAQQDAPYTAQQEQTWIVARHNEDAEARILEDLYRALNPAAP